MASTIWKYPLRVTDIQKISMPNKAQLLSVHLQGEFPALWVRCDPEAPKRDRLINTFGTGHPISGKAKQYIGTYQLPNYGLVFHVFDGGWEVVDG